MLYHKQTSDLKTNLHFLFKKTARRTTFAFEFMSWSYHEAFSLGFIEYWSQYSVQYCFFVGLYTVEDPGCGRGRLPPPSHLEFFPSPLCWAPLPPPHENSGSTPDTLNELSTDSIYGILIVLGLYRLLNYYIYLCSKNGNFGMRGLNFWNEETCNSSGKMDIFCPLCSMNGCNTIFCIYVWCSAEL